MQTISQHRRARQITAGVGPRQGKGKGRGRVSAVGGGARRGFAGGRGGWLEGDGREEKRGAAAARGHPRGVARLLARRLVSLGQSSAAESRVQQRGEGGKEENNRVRHRWKGGWRGRRRGMSGVRSRGEDAVRSCRVGVRRLRRTRRIAGWQSEGRKTIKMRVKTRESVGARFFEDKVLWGG